MKDNKKIITFQKRADIDKNRIIIPKFFIDKYGREFYMQVYEDYIKLTPINPYK